MGFQAGDPATIWLAWDGDDNAVVGFGHERGYASKPLNAIIVCHDRYPLPPAEGRSGTVADMFRIEPGKDFFRPFRLPTGAEMVELLVDDGQQAESVRVFRLVRPGATPQDEPVAGTIRFPLTAHGASQIRCRYFPSPSGGHEYRDDSFTGWAGRFLFWPDAENGMGDNVSWVSKISVVVPHSDETLRISPLFSFPPSFLQDLPESASVPSIRGAAFTALRNSGVQIRLSGGADFKVNGLFAVVVSACREIEPEWRRDVHLSETVFARLANESKDNFEDNLLQNSWPADDAARAADDYHKSLTTAHRWYDLSNSDGTAQFSVVPDDRGALLTFHDVSPGDHIVLHDAHGRVMTVDRQISDDSIAAFEVGLKGLSRLDGVYGERHKFIVELIAEMPDHGFQTGESGEFPLKRQFAEWLRSRGAPESSRKLTPLIAAAAQASDLEADVVAAEWNTLASDMAAWRLAYSIDPGGLRAARIQKPVGGNVMERAASLLGRQSAYAPMPSVEDQITAAVALLDHADMKDLALCTARLERLSLSECRFAEMAQKVRRLDAACKEPDFLSWLQQAEPGLHQTLFNERLEPKPIDAAHLDAVLEKALSASAQFSQLAQRIGGILKPAAPHSATAKHDSEALRLSRELADDGFAEESAHFMSILEENGHVPHVHKMVADQIYAAHPSKKAQGDPVLASLATQLEKRAGMALGLQILELAAKSADFHASDLPDVAQRSKRRLFEKAGAAAPLGEADQKLKNRLPDMAAAVVTHRLWLAIADLNARAERMKIPVPHRLKRSLFVWPHDAANLCEEFRAFEKMHQAKMGNLFASVLENVDAA